MIDQLVLEYADLYTKKKKLSTASKDNSKKLKSVEKQLIQYLETNNLKKIPVKIGEETMYLTVKSGVQLK